MRLSEEILSYKQEDIYAKYFKLTPSEVIWCASDKNNRLSNPLRDDPTPSLSFKYYNNKLIVRDFGDGRYDGDIFESIGFILNKNHRNTDDFIYICNHIRDTYFNSEINIVDYSSISTTNKPNSDKHTFVDIGCKYRNLKDSDYSWYFEQGIRHRIVNSYVRGVSRFYINGDKMGYYSTDRDPCYEFIVNGKYKKLYFPMRNKNSQYPRFITNNPFQLEDIGEINVSNDIIICKSMKEKMLAISFLMDLNIRDVALQSASSEISKVDDWVHDYLIEHRIYNIYTMFDNDETGLNAMNQFKKDRGYKPLLFTADAKDPTEYVRKFNYLAGLERFKNIYEHIKRNRNV